LPGGSLLATKRTLQALRDPAQTERRRLEADRRRAAIRIMESGTPVARLIARHTRDLLRRYYKAGKISTPIADRKVDDVLVPMTAAEREVYEAVEDYISHIYASATAERRNAVGFVMTVYRKRVASSFAALRETLKGRLEDLRQPGRSSAAEDDVAEDEGLDEAMDADEATSLAMQAAEFEARAGIDDILKAVKRLPADTKATHLASVLEQLRARGYEQVLVFTQFTDTLDFLREHVAASGRSVMCFSGRGGEIREKSGHWRTVPRDEVKRLFRQGGADVLLCTDAAAEGLNFQFCGAVVNYDMPWNPMKVEQRIGRIDRLGQRFPEIRIVNLHYADTVETDVYQALRLRIGLFSQFVGKLQPILANLPRQLAEISLLAPRERRERERTQLVGQLESNVRAVEQQGFDLDAVVDADLEEPPRPEPYYDLNALDMVICCPGLLPPGVSAEPLAPREYKYSAPGMREALRVTTDPDYFDQHASSVEMWSPGSPLFPTMHVGELPPESIGNRLADTVKKANSVASTDDVERTNGT
jgi:SNF2 family DNA or RNA helicase